MTAMNFFGHVVVTSWRSADPAVALGAMMPDLQHMCRGRVLSPRDPRVARGMALHHRTDAVFHSLAEFTRLEHEATRALQARGVSRGGAMGTAHVAVELLLDGVLLDDRAAGALYLAALECPQAHAADTDMDWQEPEQAERWCALRARLSAHGLPQGYREPDIVTERVALILRGYKTLALAPHEVEHVRAYMKDLHARVTDAAPAIMSALREGMLESA